MLRAPKALDKDTKKAVKLSYEQSIDQFGDQEIAYLKAKLPSVVDMLSESGARWRRSLGRVGQLLGKEVFAKRRNQRISPELQKKMIAALWYLCDPYDIIPDYKPGVGYLDDVMVMNLCLRGVKKDCPQLYGKIEAVVEAGE